MDGRQEVTALVVGAGPSGLMAALCLRRLGVDVLVIDAKSGPTKESRALVLQARSLEIFAQLGIADLAIAQAREVVEVAAGQGEHTLGRVPIGDFGKGVSPFPGMWVLEQSKTEQLLLDALTESGGTVMWGHELKALDFVPGAGSIAQTANQAEQRPIAARFVIGADGSGSKVREICRIAFDGSTNPQHFYVIDAQGVEGLEPAVNMRTAENDFLLTFPMTGARHLRLLGVLDDLHPEEPATRARLKRVFNVNYEHAEWFASYRVQHRVARQFGSASAFLIGDAAHVHSPVGAQGMNTGLQDAHNLACKLADVVAGAPDSVLDQYEAERRPVARQLIAFTGRAFGVVTSRSRFAGFIRGRGIRVLAPIGVRLVPRLLGGRRLFGYLSQTRIRYAMPGQSRRDAIVGRRLSWNGTNHEPLRSFTWQLHAYGADPGTLHAVAGALGLDAHAFGVDPFRRLRKARLYLIRPDGFVAADSPVKEAFAIERFTSSLPGGT